jgi:glycerate 2-kinase
VRGADAARLVAGWLALHSDTLPASATLPDRHPIVFVAAGKAAVPMARAAATTLDAGRMRGVVAAPKGWGGREPGHHAIEWFEGGHPVPDGQSVRAGRRALALARSLGHTGWLLVLLSGGASSLLAAPAGVSLDDKVRITRLLLEAGVDIHSLNCVRKHLSQVKGGGLALEGVPCVTLALSDVTGAREDDPSAIGSGPTSPDPTTFGEAVAILRGSGCWETAPLAVRERLRRGAAGELPETPKPGDPRLARSRVEIVGSRRDAMAAAAREAADRGYEVVTLTEAVTGEARQAGPALIDQARAAAARRPGSFCMLASGETTVRVAGRGRGGRNQELVLAAIGSLASFGRLAALASVGTDGVDGPTDAAGALADTTTAGRAGSRGHAPAERYLADNDAYTYFDALGDLIRTGPTGTNVGDLQVVLVGGGGT